MTGLVEAPLVIGILLAWSLAAPPGPGNAVIAHEAARRGWWAGVASGMGAVTGDLVMFLLMWLGVLSVLAFVPALKVALGAMGAMLMLRFAWGAWRSARDRVQDQAAGAAGGFGKVLVLIVTSPFNWAWWATAGSTMFADLGFTVVAGFFVGLVAWVLLWSALAREGATRIRGFREIVGYVSAVLLAGFAVLVGWVALRTALDLFAL